MLELLLLPFHLALALVTLAGSIILFPLRLVCKLTFGIVALIGALFLVGGVLMALVLLSLAPGVILFILGLGIFLTLCRR